MLESGLKYIAFFTSLVTLVLVTQKSITSTNHNVPTPVKIPPLTTMRFLDMLGNILPQVKKYAKNKPNGNPFNL